jgi:hypothetical protein
MRRRGPWFRGCPRWPARGSPRYWVGSPSRHRSTTWGPSSCPPRHTGHGVVVLWTNPDDNGGHRWERQVLVRVPRRCTIDRSTWAHPAGSGCGCWWVYEGCESWCVGGAACGVDDGERFRATLVGRWWALAAPACRVVCHCGSQAQSLNKLTRESTRRLRFASELFSALRCP